MAIEISGYKRFTIVFKKFSAYIIPIQQGKTMEKYFMIKINPTGQSLKKHFPFDLVYIKQKKINQFQVFRMINTI